MMKKLAVVNALFINPTLIYCMKLSYEVNFICITIVFLIYRIYITKFNYHLVNKILIYSIVRKLLFILYQSNSNGR